MWRLQEIDPQELLLFVHLLLHNFPVCYVPGFLAPDMYTQGCGTFYTKPDEMWARNVCSNSR